jgi:hypothetical protein
MVHAHRGEFAAAAGDPLTQRTLPLFFDVLRLLLRAEVTVVPRRRSRTGSGGRASSRSRSSPSCASFSVTIVGAELDEWQRAYESFDRVSVPTPSIDVNTTDGYEPGLAEIVAFVNRR